MGESESPIHIVLTVENLTKAQVQDINKLTRELGDSLKAKIPSEENISYVEKNRLAQDAKVADLLVMAGQIVIQVAPTVANHVTPWILAKIDEAVKRFSVQRGRRIKATVVIGNNEEVITPETTEADIDAAKERIKHFSRSEGKRFALIIGNSKYDDPGLPALNSPATDADGLAKVLENPNIGAFKVQKLINKNYDEIRRAIEQFYVDKQPNDLLVLYYSGHGIKPHNGKQLLLTAKNTVTSIDSRRTTTITDSFILENMRDSASDKQILILDCCFGAAIMEGAKSTSAIGEQVDSLSPFQSVGHGYVIITASDKTQYATDGKHFNGIVEPSLFTKHLILGLEKGYADKNNDGAVDIDELYIYVHNQIAGKQTPKKKSEIAGMIVLGINPNRNIPPAELPDEITSALLGNVATKLGAVTLLEQYWEDNSGDKAVKTAVKSALDRLAKDDSMKVSSAAKEIFGKYFGTKSSNAPERAAGPVPFIPVETSPGYKSSKPPAFNRPPTTSTTKNSNLKIVVITILIFVAFFICIALSNNY